VAQLVDIVAQLVDVAAGLFRGNCGSVSGCAIWLS
jgi:hypothetical protein